jgi:hypothetical protein
VVFSLFVDAGSRNYLVLIASMIGGVLFLQLGLTHQRHASLAFVLFSIMTVSTLFQDGAGKLGSLALTFTYSIGYFAIGSLLDKVNDKRGFLIKIIRRIIIAFSMVSIFQLLSSMAGFPVPNLMAAKGLWSYNSLAYEPSQLGRIIGISMLCYIMLSRLPGKPVNPKEHQKLLIAFFTTMLLSGSSLAMIAILAVYGLSRSLPWFALIFIASVFMWPIFFMIEFDPIKRFLLLASSMVSLELDQVLLADHSGGIRFAPLLIYYRDMSIAETSFWLGYGSEGTKYFFQNKIPGVASGIIFGGFLPGFAVIYGFLPFAFFIWIFVLRYLNQTTIPLIAFWVIFMTSSAFNAQVFWYGLIIIQIAWIASHNVTSSFTRSDHENLNISV